MAQLLLKNVMKEYPGSVIAVRDFNLQVADGEFVVLVGPSGCGKTTTLRMIAGLEEITSGTITIGDRVVNDIHPKDRDIAMVFQNYALYPHMSVYKNLAFALKLRKFPKDEIERKVSDAASILGIENLLQRKPKALSGGQRQRVALGRAIVRDPKVFLFDEPLSNLDAKLRVEMRAELKRLHKRLRTTTVYVTHDQEEAMTLGDRVVVMNDALMQQAGSPLNVYRRPHNHFVAGFLGTPPMNFLDGKIEKRNGSWCFIENGEKGLCITLAHDDDSSYQDRHGDAVTLGIRPEHIHLIDITAESKGGYPLFVQLVEPLGDRMDVYLQTPAGTKIVARLTATDAIKVDAVNSFTIDTSQVHLFNRDEKGLRLGEEVGEHELAGAAV